jgi:predicted GIY-YIG superfamily endonuclease
MPYHAYIMASSRNGTLYAGVTNDIARRDLSIEKASAPDSQSDTE